MALDLSAEKVIMIGVGALGLYAVYRLVNAPKDQTPTDQPQTKPAADQVKPALEGMALPRVAGPIGTPPPSLPIVALPSTRTVRLEQGLEYRGRLELSPGDKEDIAHVIVRSMGLDEGTIRIFSTPAEAASQVPAFALANAGQGTRWFSARQLDPTRNVTKADQVAAMWVPVAIVPPAIAGLHRLSRAAGW